MKVGASRRSSDAKLFGVVPGQSIQPNLDGNGVRSSRVSLYVDESELGPWLYIGVLAVDDNDRESLFDHLQELRTAVGCDSELHYKEIEHHTSGQLASCWLEHAMHDVYPAARFHVLGIDRTKLDRSSFGDDAKTRASSIYRRFLRSALIYPLRSYFPAPTVVRGIFHDYKNLASDDILDWHTPWKLREVPGVTVATERVHFVDSDHRRSGYEVESNFIQLVDLILGATRTCMQPEESSKRKHQRDLAFRWLPLMERLGDDRRSRNPRSRFGHVNRCSVSFFPRGSLVDDLQSTNLERLFASQFFRRPPTLGSYFQGNGPDVDHQLTLDL